MIARMLYIPSLGHYSSHLNRLPSVGHLQTLWTLDHNYWAHLVELQRLISKYFWSVHHKSRDYWCQLLTKSKWLNFVMALLHLDQSVSFAKFSYSSYVIFHFDLDFCLLLELQFLPQNLKSISCWKYCQNCHLNLPFWSVLPNWCHFVVTGSFDFSSVLSFNSLGWYFFQFSRFRSRLKICHSNFLIDLFSSLFLSYIYKIWIQKKVIKNVKTKSQLKW